MAPPSQQQIITAVNDSQFNALLLEAFLCGLYTLLFGYTLRKLLCKENKKIYATVLTFLWVIVMVAFAFDWQYHRTAFVIDNDSPLDIEEATVGDLPVQSLSILDNVFSMCCNLLADALLIWRCYILWEDNRWVLVPLPILLAAAVVVGSLQNVPQLQNTEIESTTFFVSFLAVSVAITFMGTSLIILRILLVTRSSPLTAHTSAYQKIQKIIVESGILYTIAMFITGVTLLLEFNLRDRASISLTELTAYAEAILVPLSGIAPTLIAVRVGHGTALQNDAGASRAWSQSRALSHLTFRRTVQRNSTFDVEDGVPGCGDSSTMSSIKQEGQGGHNEKIAVHSSDATL